VRRVEFLFVVALLIEQSFCQFHRLGKGCLHGLRLFGKPARHLPIHTPQRGFELRGSTPLPAQLTRMVVTVVLEWPSWAYSHVTLAQPETVRFRKPHQTLSDTVVKPGLVGNVTALSCTVESIVTRIDEVSQTVTIQIVGG
jgi:hypothetical protein